MLEAFLKKLLLFSECKVSSDTYLETIYTYWLIAGLYYTKKCLDMVDIFPT